MVNVKKTKVMTEDELLAQGGFVDDMAPSGKKKTTKKADKKPLEPIIPSYEACTVTVLDKLMPGEPVSWRKTKQATMPLSSQELYDKAVAHAKKTGTTPSGQFQALGPNQQSIVNRIVDARNLDERVPNAQWVLFGVKRNYVDIKSGLRVWKMNNALRITLKRQDRHKDTVPESTGKKNPYEVVAQPDEIIDLDKPVTAAKTTKKKKEDKDEDSPTEKKKKKKSKDGQQMQSEQFPFEQNFNPNGQFSNVPMGDFADEPPNGGQQFGGQQFGDQQFGGQQFGGQQFGGQEYDQSPDQYMPEDMPHGAIPAPPLQHIPPPVADPPQHAQNPFQPHPHVPFQQDTGFPMGQSPGAQFSARRRSHSRPRVEEDRHHRDHSIPRQRSISRPRSDRSRHHRGNSNDDQISRLAAMMDAKLDMHTDKMDDALRRATATHKVNDWPNMGVTSSYPTQSSNSSTRDDVWSHGSSNDRGYQTPGTSPDRNYYPQQPPRGSLHRRNSSNAKYPVEERRRYHPNHGVYVEPHATHREDRQRGRERAYPRDHRQIGPDDYPPSHFERERSRPRIQRRVTDFPQGLRDADFGRRGARENVDYTRVDDRRRYDPVFDSPRGERRQPRYHG